MCSVSPWQRYRRGVGGSVCSQHILAVRKWRPQVEPDLTLSTNGSGLPTTPPGGSITGGRVSSVDPRNVGITKAKACFVGMATTQAWRRGFWESRAPVLLAEQEPDGERSLPGFCSLLLFSRRSSVFHCRSTSAAVEGSLPSPPPFL